MKKYLLVLFGFFCIEACSPQNEGVKSPSTTPEGNKSKPSENNASKSVKPEDNRTDAPSPKQATGLAGFLPGKQISLKIANDAFKLAPKFGANGTWTNTLDPKQHGSYLVKEDGRVILNLPDKTKLTLLFSEESVKIDDVVDVLVDDTLIFSTVESLKED